MLTNARSYQTGKHLEAFVLLVIALEPLHGAAVIGQLKSILPPLWTVDDGQVYRLLRRLESQGSVASTWVTEDIGAPIRVYRLTDQGRVLLDEWHEDIALRIQSLQTFVKLWSKSRSDTPPPATSDRAPDASRGDYTIPTKSRSDV